jgi:hypothetical protein
VANGGFTTIHASHIVQPGHECPPIPALTLTLLAPDSLLCSGDPNQPLPLNGQLLVENLTGAACDNIQVTLVGGIGVTGGFSSNLGSLAPGDSLVLPFLLEALTPWCGQQRQYSFIVESDQTAAQVLQGQFFLPCCGKPEVTIEYILGTDLLHLEWTAVTGADSYQVYGVEQGWPAPGTATLLATTPDTWLDLPRLSQPPTRFFVVTAQY